MPAMTVAYTAGESRRQTEKEHVDRLDSDPRDPNYVVGHRGHQTVCRFHKQALAYVVPYRDDPREGAPERSEFGVSL